MTRWGIGPPFTILSLLYAAAIALAHQVWLPTTEMEFIPQSVATVCGVVLIGLGVVLYVVSIPALTRAYNSGELQTGGVYAYIRHPIYAAFIVFIVPGIVVLLRSLPGLTIPIFMYIVFRALIRAEEDHLLTVFGEQYEVYHNRVGAILPRLPR